MRIMVADILNKLRSTSSIIEKKKILIDNTDNELFKNVIKLAYSPLIRFNVSSILLQDVPANNGVGLEELVSELISINKSNIRGFDLIDEVSELLSKGSKANNSIIKGIIDKDLELGLGASVFNKVYGKNFIRTSARMGMVLYSEDKVNKLFNMGDVCSQVKMDGRYANVVIDKVVTVETKNGVILHLRKVFDNLYTLEESLGEAIVLNGELMLKGYEDNRTEAKTIITAIVNALASESATGIGPTQLLLDRVTNYGNLRDLTNLLYITVWDYIPYQTYINGATNTTPYRERYNRLVNALSDYNNVELVETRPVISIKEAMCHFKDAQAKGAEGTVLKSMSGVWCNGKSNNQINLTKRIRVNLKVVSFNYAAPNSRYEKLVSSINTVSSCGKLVTSPGGMTEEVRQTVTEDVFKLKGSIVTVECDGIMSGGKVYSTLRPRVIEFRVDKHTADSLEDCLAIEEASNSIH